ncbi:MAG: hypothetical protein WDW38_009946 [Sanguina aurantia]
MRDPELETELLCYINGKRQVLPPNRAETTLLQYLREIGLTGTKLGCGEGGCGACTVMLSHYDSSAGKVVHRSANACLCPLYAVEGMQVITVEGLGNSRDGLHPVQARLAASHGSQCGFCTPGFVMSMYSLLRSQDEAPSEEEIEDALGGNLCRCTGYRPILDAFKTFAKVDPRAYTEEALSAARGNACQLLPSGGTVVASAASETVTTTGQTSTGPVCPSTGLPCGCGAGAAAWQKRRRLSMDLMRLQQRVGPRGVVPKVPTAEPIFPPELKLRRSKALCVPGEHVTWHRPVELQKLLDLKKQFPAARLVVGSTEVGIEMKYKDTKVPVVLTPTHVPELNQISITSEGVEVGAAVTLTNMMVALQAQIATRPKHQVSSFLAVVNQLRWFAGNQIRNVSSVGGNICTGSPISDLNPIWMACRAVFTALGAGTGSRTIKASEFFLGYRQVDLQPHEILYKITIPFTRKFEYVREFKQSPRREDDIAIVNAGMRVQLAPREEADGSAGWVIEEAEFAFGGVAAKAVVGKAVAAALVGQPLDQATLKAGLAAVRQDVVIGASAPGGKVEYRQSLAASFLFKFLTHAALMLEKDAPAGGAFIPDLPPTHRSAAKEYSRAHAHGVQFHASNPKVDDIVGQSYQHMSADLQVSGEAQYVDDLKLSADALSAVLVTSSRPHARLLSVDPTAALALPGVVGYYCAKDVPGSNIIGPVIFDEEVFATEIVTCVGQVIGVLVADNEVIARRASKLVAIEYEDLPAVMSCEEAIAAGSYHEYDGKIECGDVDTAMAACDHVIEGTYKVGGQEHFYLETQVCCVIPGEHDELTLFSSTQAPAKHQKYVAGVLGLPDHKVVSKSKRVGGGFGGKETRALFVHAAIAVPAYLLRRPVRISLDRDEDMQMTGQRHAFLANYKVGFSSRGMVQAVHIDLYNNAGNSLDLSGAVMDTAMLHSDCGYKVPHMRLVGHLCRTNQASNTAFRGFGGPQGLMFAEMWVDQISKTIGMPSVDVRSANMYTEGDLTHYGQPLEECKMQICWDKALANAGYAERAEKVAQFNAVNRWRKRGLAATPTKFGQCFTVKFLNQAGALAHIYVDGTVLLTHGGVEMGQGLHTKMAMIAAQALSVPLHKVYISETSTDKVPNASPTAASASSDLYGGAVLDACSQLAARLAPFREALGPDASFKAVVNAAYMERVDLCAHGFYKTPDVTGYGEGGNRPFNYYCYGAAVSEVELDTLTGDFQILRTDIVMDVGNPINPAIDIGQIEGAFVQGMGLFCLEELQWGDKQHGWIKPGQLFTRGPGTYKIPTSNDIPIDFRVSLLTDAPNARAVHSSKVRPRSVHTLQLWGSPPLFLGASVFFALKEAVYSARADAGHPGWFQLDSPATGERLRMLCADHITAPYAAHDIRCKISC